ncbi:glycosyltransferase family 2 protein [Candidatus Thioglobus sp.]|nr:glycosyltransferase family 2 protein [Candidatus Thioglobus sp.]
MNLVILLAGSSEIFKDKGQKYPKPLVEIQGRVVIDRVVENLKPLMGCSDKVVFLIRKDDDQKFHLSDVINLLVPKSRVLLVNGETSGAACTALLSVEHVDNMKPLLLVNGDQIIDADYLSFLKVFSKKGVDGGTVVFQSVHPRWSYVRIDDNGQVTESAEKKPISNNATAGFYYYKKANLFFKYAERMIMKDAHINGKFFVCPVFNEMILDQKVIKTKKIKPEQYHSLMTPELIKDYKKFIERGEE